MKFYLASKLENHEEVRKLKALLEAYGHEHTYDWTVHGPVFRAGESRRRNEKVMGDVSEAEVQGVLDADILVVLLPGGRGTHVELGVGLAAGKPIILASSREELGEATAASDGHPCAFHYHRTIQQIFVPNQDDRLAQVVAVFQAEATAAAEYSLARALTQAQQTEEA